MVFSVIWFKQGTESTDFTKTAYASRNADAFKRLQDQKLDKQAYCSE